jgi:hypothetical protein
MNPATETITCKCGHTDTLQAFVYLQPWQVFRCPGCKFRFIRALAPASLSTPMGGGKTRVVLKEFNPCDPQFARY